jgi:hypothetical protein
MHEKGCPILREAKGGNHNTHTTAVILSDVQEERCEKFANSNKPSPLSF